MILGPKKCEPIVETYRSKLRGHFRSALDPTRKTPRFLRVIATPNEEQPQKEGEGWKCGFVLLRWNVVKPYLGSMADQMKVSNM